MNQFMLDYGAYVIIGLGAAGFFFALGIGSAVESFFNYREKKREILLLKKRKGLL